MLIARLFSARHIGACCERPQQPSEWAGNQNWVLVWNHPLRNRMHNGTSWGTAPSSFTTYTQSICLCRMETAQKSPHGLIPKHVPKFSNTKAPALTTNAFCYLGDFKKSYLKTMKFTVPSPAIFLTNTSAECNHFCERFNTIKHPQKRTPCLTALMLAGTQEGSNAFWVAVDNKAVELKYQPPSTHSSLSTLSYCRDKAVSCPQGRTNSSAT